MDDEIMLDMEDDGVEIPTLLGNEVFQPLIRRENSIVDLPIDTLKLIASNLDYDSFVKLTSTCRVLNNLERDEVVVRSVCGIKDNKTTIEGCVASVRKQKQTAKNERDRIIREKKKRKEDFVHETKMCNRRCSSNIFIESLALMFILVSMIIGPLSADRTIDVSMKITGWLLIIPTIFYGVLPHFLWCWGCMTVVNGDMINENRDVKVYGGAYDYFNQLWLWSNKGGFRAAKFSIIVYTWVLFMLWCYDIINFGYVLIPSAIYCLLYPCFGIVDCNPYQADDCKCAVSGWRCLLYVPTCVLVFIGLVLVILRCFAVIEDFYSLCILPIALAAILYPILYCAKCCVNAGCSSCCGCYGCDYFDVYDTTQKESEVVMAGVLCTEWWFAMPGIVLFVILLSVLLDGYADWSFSLVFLPAWYVFGFYIIVTQLTVFITECQFKGGCVCCPGIFPQSCVVAKELCCNSCTGDPCDEFFTFCSSLCSTCCDNCDPCCQRCGFFCEWYCDHCCCCCEALCSFMSSCCSAIGDFFECLCEHVCCCF